MGETERERDEERQRQCNPVIETVTAIYLSFYATELAEQQNQATLSSRLRWVGPSADPIEERWYTFY